MMQRDPLVYGILGALIGGVVVWLLATSSVNTNNVGMMQMMGIRYGSQGMMGSSAAVDAHFIEQMIPHHEDAITMAKLGLQKAKRTEVKALAQNIIESQSNEIDQMKDWYQEWFGKDLPTGEDIMSQHGMMGSAKQNSMHMGMMGDEEDIVRLEDADDFDKAFVEEMIPHHQMAVMMANMLKNGTTRPEMKKLAADIITAQSNEIDQMRAWLQSWSK